MPYHTHATKFNTKYDKNKGTQAIRSKLKAKLVPNPCKSPKQPNRATSPPLASRRQKGKRARLMRPKEALATVVVVVIRALLVVLIILNYIGFAVRASRGS